MWPQCKRVKLNITEFQENGASIGYENEANTRFQELLASLAQYGKGLIIEKLARGEPFLFNQKRVSIVLASNMLVGVCIVTIELDTSIYKVSNYSLQKMLEQNYTASIKGGGFAASPLNGDLVYSELFWIFNLTLDRLLSELDRMQRSAQTFLTKDES